MIDLYVYYKVREIDADALAPRVRALQQALAGHHAAAAQLKRRPEARDGLQTWMEVYPAVADDFAAVLDAAAQEAGVDAFIAGPRRAEVFTDLAPAASLDTAPCA
ncbi:DUF4936 family protein [Massilia sp. YIM B02763]|uniref:DUF4936 family protein n=1 Tax=Massilia sp. YIM B02763 TaxID=3050130 RepID=UPI0025B6BD4A|nr:DUF4936 family protein [Massilia sp. YIM B02763]MDN4054954.1 DUF4936 family protein [Massilia sp. YIM B02763]